MTEILNIKGPQDWESRANFRRVLHGTAEDLDRIIGKYDLPRAPSGMPRQTGMVHCGLNGCNELHFRGFLVLLKNGLETIVGRDCGREKIGAVFEEIEATFADREILANRQKLLTELQTTRQEAIQLAEELMPQCRQAHERINSIVQELRGYTGFWSKLADVARMDGRVMKAAETSDMTERRATVDLVVAAVIRQSHLLFQDTSVHHRGLQIKVLHWLQSELAQEIATAVDDLKKLEALVSKAANLRETLRSASEFVRDAQILLDPSNLHGLREVFTHQLTSHQRTNALNRALRRLGGTT